MLEEKRVLSEFTFHAETNQVSFLWKDLIIRDGVVALSENHRGAYPMNELGEIDESIRDIVGKTISEMIGESADAIFKSNAKLIIEFNDLKTRYNNLLEDFESAKSNLIKTELNLQSANENILGMQDLISIKDQNESLKNTLIESLRSERDIFSESSSKVDSLRSQLSETQKLLLAEKESIAAYRDQIDQLTTSNQKTYDLLSASELSREQINNERAELSRKIEELKSQLAQK